MKLSAKITKNQIALPLDVSYDFRKSHWLILVRFLVFAVQIVHVYAPKVFEVPAQPVVSEPEKISPTKAYADQRQKAPRNRKHKPSKAMKNLYQLQ